MQIEILLNPASPGYSAVKPDLIQEVNALDSQDVSVSSKTAQPPAGALAVPEVFQFLIDHSGDSIKFLALIRAVIELVITVAKRRGGKGDKQQPTAVIIVGEERLTIPASPEKQRSFLKSVSAKTTKARQSKKNPKTK